MKFKLKATKQQPEKDFICEVRDSLDEVRDLLYEANGIKDVLKSYEEEERSQLVVEYKENFLTTTIVRIKMDDRMGEYLKDRLAQIEKEIKNKVVSND